ncbi:hypothetical protein RJ639_041703 [Escallonia herrerae]|uniref:Uncharacterized protein n=1 Tax=Escallonia herrerae TaxID=1293975 RepID=A0AA88WEZ4_9ASTE|nr:hypothetical protein RJ639_041703 [Escallonia herrerae]
MANNTTSLFFLLITLTLVSLPPYHESAFDFFKLVQQWPPSFCKFQRCAQPIIKTFTIHGLWPDNYTTTLDSCIGNSFQYFQAYFNLAMQLYDRLNILEVFAKSNISPGATGNHLLPQLKKSLVAHTGKVPDFKCQLGRRTATPTNLLKEVVSCYNSYGTAIDCPVSQLSNSCNRRGNTILEFPG